MDQIYINGMRVQGPRCAIRQLEHHIRKAGAKLEHSIGGKEDLYTPVKREYMDEYEKFIGKKRRDWTYLDYEKVEKEIDRQMEADLAEKRAIREAKRKAEYESYMEFVRSRRKGGLSSLLQPPPRYPPKQ